MAVFIVLCGIVIIMYILCGMYCSYRKHKSTFKGAESYTESGIQGKEYAGSPALQTQKSFIRSVINCALRWLDSILRFSLFITSYIPSHHVRDFLYRFVFRVSIGKRVVIYYGCEIRSPWNLYISDGAIIGDKCTLDARSGIYIGRNVNFSSEAAVWTLQHDVNSPDFSTVGEGKPVFIFDRVWVSTRAVILPGCVINEGSVIAGGGYCTKDTEAYGIYSGVPCKKIGIRNLNLSYEFSGAHVHFL